MQLNQIADNPGSRKGKMRVGRGVGSGKGKTAGRGYKGQKSRTGVSINGFEGGQTPIHRRLPKRGFKNISRVDYRVVNLGDLQRAIEAKTLDASKAIDTEALINAGIIRSNSNPVKLLSKGELKSKVTITVDKASKTAQAAVEKAGGSVKVAEAA